MGVHPFQDLNDIEQILSKMHPTFLKSIVISQMLLFSIFVSYVSFKIYNVIIY